MALQDAHQGYYYQDILSAYLVADALATGKDSIEFFFDQKKTPQGTPDKFDDIALKRDGVFQNFQVKYSNDTNRHVLTKADVSSDAPYDLALHSLFKSWKALKASGSSFRLCLAWDPPNTSDDINKVLVPYPERQFLIPGTTCFQISIDLLWDENEGVLASWRALRIASAGIDREEFKSFLEELILEVGYPKSSLLTSQTSDLEKLLYSTVERIGVGTYPNDHLSVDHIVHKLCNLTRTYRSTHQARPISVQEIAKQASIVLSNGAIEQNFPVDYAMLVETPDRIEAVTTALSEQSPVVVTAEPGAGKSWFIANLEKHYQEQEDAPAIVKHYCYTELGDPLQTRRVTVNVMYGNLIDQLEVTDENLRGYKTMRWGSNFEELNRLLKNIKKPTLLVVDGIDHIWRVYQKNRGGLTEDETAILLALARLDFTNPKVNLLVISQPIEQLKTLKSFKAVELPRTNELFTQTLLEKHGVPDQTYDTTSLSETITQKSQGNALYIKYLVDEAVRYRTELDIDWMSSLPDYSYNLTDYYEYLYTQVEEGRGVPYALCGAAFSLSGKDLKEITGQGTSIDRQIATLLPVLKYYVPYGGYMIYHESFKRFLIEKLEADGDNIERVVYIPLIEWLEMKDFFRSKKAYAHLLKLYVEVERYDAISAFIHEDFIAMSLLNIQPYSAVTANFKLLSKSLIVESSFKKSIIISELSSIIWQLDHHEGYINYLLAVKAMHGRQAMYDMLSYEDEQLATKSEIQNILIAEAYVGEPDIPWSLVPKKRSIPSDEWRFAIVQMLSTKNSRSLERFFTITASTPNHEKNHGSLLEEFNTWTYHFGGEWIDNVPSYLSFLANRVEEEVDLLGIINDILSREHFHIDDDWKQTLFRLRLGVRQCIEKGSSEPIEQGVNRLEKRNWFHNWLIFMIKSVMLTSQDNCTHEQVEEAFSYLVRDLKPFKGNPRTCDLYTQLPFIRETFRRGLDLCPTQESKRICVKLLERVVETTTSIHKSYSGPLTVEAYLDIVQDYLPIDEVVQAYTEYYDPLGSKRVYSDLTIMAFKYCAVLVKAGQLAQAQELFKQGIQYLTAYGYRKDRTLSELLDAAAPYQQQYGTLTPEWFFELYQFSITVTSHTDGKETHRYPMEWFGEFIQVFPTQALQFLAAETFMSEVANYHQEVQLYDLLEDHSHLLDTTTWFLLIRTLPIASSEKVLDLALDKIGQVEPAIRDTYLRWVQTLPDISGVDMYNKYSQAIVDRYKKVFGTELAAKIQPDEKATDYFPEKEENESIPPFPTKNVLQALVHIEKQDYNQEHSERIKQLVSQATQDERKLIIRSLASRNVSRSTKEQDRWLEGKHPSNPILRYSPS